MTSVAWQPIETAPKDRPILLWSGSVNVGEWSSILRKWCALINGRVVWLGDEYSGELAKVDEPTLWMPATPPHGSE